VVAFSVLSLNLRFGLADVGRNAWENRKDGVLQLFRSQQADFIATQEVNDFQAEFLAKNLPAYGYIGKRSPAPSFWQDNILFFRRSIPCLDQKHFFLSETPGSPSRSFGSRFPRQGTLGLFELQGKPVICINTHFDFEPPAQLGAAHVIKEQMGRQWKDVPAVLMGDFNATPDSACYRWLTGQRDGSETGMDFQETFKEPYPSTFHRFTGKPVAGYIDWILFRGLLRLKACRVLEAAVGATYLSDHFPVKAEFELLDVGC
jgi:endonuclease/exonuclease/phosphatase family metal-dependent hydrolase